MSNAIAASAMENGAHIACNVPVRRFLLSDPPTAGEHGRCEGVELDDGSKIFARAVVSNATPTVTFEDLVGKERLRPNLARHVAAIDTASPVTKINVRCLRGKAWGWWTCAEGRQDSFLVTTSASLPTSAFRYIVMNAAICNL